MRLTLTISGIAFIAGLAPLTRDSEGRAPREIAISVPGIPGPYCMYGLEKRLAEMPEVAGVQLLWEEERIRLALRPGASITREAIKQAIERAEYPYDYAVEL